MTNVNEGKSLTYTLRNILLGTVCPTSLYPFYIVSYYKKWVKTFWTYSRMVCEGIAGLHHII